MVSWLALWASGARSALALAVIALGSLAYGAVVGIRQESVLASDPDCAVRSLPVWRSLLSAVRRSSYPAGADRSLDFRLTLPEASAASVGRFLQTLSDRNGYGVVAIDLIRQFPFFGVGIGSFNLLVRDHYYLMTGVRTLFPDNAQNWYRHQFAELGLVGSIGWILWVVGFGWFRPFGRNITASSITTKDVRDDTRQRIACRAGRRLSRGDAYSQRRRGHDFLDSSVLVRRAGRSCRTSTVVPRESVRQTAAAMRLGRWNWLVIWAIVAASVAGTAYTARHRLRIPQLAVDVGFPYYYGFSEPERVDLAKPSNVWTGRHAVAVLFPQTRWVKVTLSVDSLNIAKGPVDVKMWCAGQLVVATKVAGVQPITHYVQLPEGAMRLLVETRVSRSVRPADFGLRDTRELGLLVGWEFVDAPPG